MAIAVLWNKEIAMSVKVIVADDHALMREALCNKLDNKLDFDVIA